MSKTKKPVHEIRLGRIKAAVWENEVEGVVRYNVTISRLYKNGKDEWKDSSSFGRDDLPLVEKVCHMTHLWIFSQSQGGVVQAVAASGSSGDEKF